MTRFIKKRSEIKKPKKMSAKKKSSPKENLAKSRKFIHGSDITKCHGGGCPFKDMCHRYTATADEQYQSYFMTPPFTVEHGKPSCEMFWGDAAERLFVELKSIVSGKKKNS